MVKKNIKKTNALAAKSNTKTNGKSSAKTQHAKALAKKATDKKTKVSNKSATVVATDSVSSRKAKNSASAASAQSSSSKTPAKSLGAKKADNNANNNSNSNAKPKNNKNNDKTKNNSSTTNNSSNDNTKNINANNTKSADSTNIVKLIEKGGAAVDPEVPHAQEYYVLPDPQHQHNGKHFCATLNLSDLKNNNNKFYLIQILVKSKTNEIFFWNRWGRVGYQGQNSMNKIQNSESAKKVFLKKYAEKTGKGYEPLEIDYANEEENKRAEKEKEKDQKNAKKVDVKDKAQKKLIFDEQVKSLLNLIYDLQLMNQQMKEIGYDANKMPLGKLSQHMIKEGYEVLREIEQVLKKSKKGDLYELSSRFYTIIPHNFGYQ